MKKTIIKLLTFSFLIFFLLVILDVFISFSLRKSTYDELGVWNDLYDGKINSEVIIQGASRAWTHIDPAIMEEYCPQKIYNLGIDGQSVWMQYLRHQVLIEYNKKPDVIIYSLDYYMFDNRRGLYNLDQFLPFFWDSKIRSTVSHYKGFHKLDYYLPFFRYNQQLESVIYAAKIFFNPKHNYKSREKGYASRDIEWTGEFERVKEQYSEIMVPVNKEAVDHFEDFLKECINDDIRIVFIYSPEYIEGQEFVRNRKPVLNIFYRFAKKYDIPFYDYSDDPMCKNRDNFYNASHMNRKGASKFSKKLVLDLQKDNLLPK